MTLWQWMYERVGVTDLARIAKHDPHPYARALATEVLLAKVERIKRKTGCV